MTTDPAPPMTTPVLLALLWGAALAAFLQFTPAGRWLVKRHTWTTVVAGVGVDLLVARTVVPAPAWSRLVTIIAASALPIVARSLLNEEETA